MIGKVMIGKSFRGCIAYCLEDKPLEKRQVAGSSNRATVLHFNQCFGDKKELTEQFNDVRKLNLKLSKPVLHITLSFAPGECVKNAQLQEIVKACAQEMGFEKNQYIAVAHSDTGHQHLHIVANRIGFDGRTVSDSNSFKKIAEFCRKMEREFRLQSVQSPQRFLPKEQRHTARYDSRKEALKKDIQTCLDGAKGYDGFESNMRALGYRIEKGRGIAFMDDKGVRTKGSDVGFSLSKIEQQLASLPAPTPPDAGKELTEAGFKVPKKELSSLLEKNTTVIPTTKLDTILRSEPQPEKLPAELWKRKKKRRPRHL